MQRGTTRRRCSGLVRVDPRSEPSSTRSGSCVAAAKGNTTLTWIGTLLQLFPGKNAADDSSDETEKTEERTDE